MNSDIENERYIVVGENISFLDFIALISKDFGITPPKKIVPSWMLSIGWRLDWLKHKLTGKKRHLTKNLCKTLGHKNYYSADKFLENQKDFKFKPISESVSEVCQIFLRDV